MKPQAILVVEMEKMRSVLVNASSAQSDATKAIIRTALNDPMFPLTFLIRNVMVLEAEVHWQRMFLHERRSALLRMLRERCYIFCEIKEWLSLEAKLPQPDADLSASMQKPQENSAYCTHCGGCCEIASGLADFPEKSQFPFAWRKLFGTGLGANHRFCAFLWELNGKGLSVCSIHEWRPLPCRLFAEEECQNLMEDQDFSALLDQSRLADTCRKLCALLDGR